MTTCLVLSVLIPFGFQQPAPPADRPVGQRVIESFLRHESERLDASFLAGIESKDDWEQAKPKRREQYLEMLGLWPLPEKTPLEAKITGTVERDLPDSDGGGFVIEKLHFQSRPHLYVTGNLYRPKQTKPGEKLPAVLYVCGHSGRGRDGNKTAFQHHGMWFATHGYVCLTIDTLQLGEIAGKHHGTYNLGRWWWQARGYTPAGVECWNGIRAIDYLQSRPDVDPDKIAVTGISGGGAATFWIAAADERVKVAVPVSGMSDLEDYVANKVVNGHCDCMFLINTHRWAWTDIAALVAPRPMLSENSGHDTIFPMPSNDRIRARLESLYRLYTEKPETLFDIGVTPGGHSDNPELRLMAYRWINRHLKGDNAPVTEPPLEPFEGKELRAFPDDLPADEINSKIDESFVPVAAPAAPKNAADFRAWRERTLAELRRVSFGAAPRDPAAGDGIEFKLGGKEPATGFLTTEVAVFSSAAPPVRLGCAWRYFPAKNDSDTVWIIVLGPDDSFDERPSWAAKIVGGDGVLLVAPRGTGPTKWEDKPPFRIQRSHALLGRTVDSSCVTDVAAMIEYTHYVASNPTWKIAGRGEAGVIAAYAAALASEHCISEVAVVDPPASHRDGPIFLNVLRVCDIPDAIGLVAPRPVTIVTKEPHAFESTRVIVHAAGGNISLRRP